MLVGKYLHQHRKLPTTYYIYNYKGNYKSFFNNSSIIVDSKPGLNAYECGRWCCTVFKMFVGECFVLCFKIRSLINMTRHRDRCTLQHLPAKKTQKNFAIVSTSTCFCLSENTCTFPLDLLLCNRLLDNQVVQCWLWVREVPGSIHSQGPHHTEDVIKMVPVVPLFGTQQ